MGVVSARDELYMERALELAREAAAWGEVPVGAVVVHRDTIVAEAFNCRESWRDPTAHAELIALRAAAKNLNRWRLSGTTLYVTLELALCVEGHGAGRTTTYRWYGKIPKAVLFALIPAGR